MSDLDALSDVSTLTPIPSSPLSSALSSVPDSPIIPPGWRDFTPPPSQDAGEDMPPARKRRKIEPKIRTTQHLDLTSDITQSDYDRSQAIDALLKALRNRRKIVVIAGAGISVSAGIPDFRSSHGLFRTLRGEHKLKSSGKALFDASVYKDDSSTSHFHDMVRKLSKMSAGAKPTPFHRFLARLSSEGRLLRLYTQNVDGIETSLPPLATQIPLQHKAPFPQTIQLHGGLEKMMCQKCRHISDFQAHLFNGPVPPSCPECVEKDTLRTTHAGKRSHGVGRLRPRIVLYNEHNPDEEAIGAVTTADFRTRPDAVVVVGTSMKIPAVRRITSEMCKIVRDRREGTTIWINRDPVPTGKDLDDCWDLIVKGDSDDVAKLANLKEWDDATPDLAEEYTDSDLEKVKSAQGKLEVIVPTTPKKQDLLDLKLTMPAMTPPLSRNGDGKVITHKTKTPGKSSPLKITISIPSPKITLNLKNPASQGRKLSDVLGGKENKTKAKPKATITKKPAQSRNTKKSVNQPKLTGKISKATNRQPITTKKMPDPLSPRRDTNTIVPPKEETSKFSSLESSPNPETPPALTEWNETETISPKGNVPADMRRLLN